MPIDSVYAIFYCMAQLVIDTDVFVAALLSRNDSSVAREIIRRCLQGYYQPLFGVALFAEYEALLSRDKLFANCNLGHKEREMVFSALLKQARWIEIYFAWRPNLQDESDNHLIELAVAGGAQAIVSRNTRDFKNAELLFADTKILTPKQCLEVFKCPP
ncbi:MAG: putative toxin-antitoxin system toxin component, PIN family [Gallionellaceae bacterium]|nr:putative toxin-antitoxin system toxin component, PIN family [Gallionellaceae bacterium]